MKNKTINLHAILDEYTNQFEDFILNSKEQLDSEQLDKLYWEGIKKIVTGTIENLKLKIKNNIWKMSLDKNLTETLLHENDKIQEQIKKLEDFLLQV